MALLKRKQSTDYLQYRKLSTNSSSSNNNSNSNISSSSNNNNNNNITITTSSSDELNKNAENNTSHTPISPNNTNTQNVTRNNSRLSSAPMSGHSVGKRFSLSLRSFSSNSSSNHNSNITNSNSKEDLNSKNACYGSEKNDLSTVSSPATVSDSKLIFDWDVTDPKAWTWQRVVIWLQVNEFNTKWISFFRRSQISGNDFLKLMANENFAKIEKYLPSSHNSSYNRFQHLLKRTMEHNVIYQHHSYSRSASSLDSGFSKKSNYSKHLRTGSDQVSVGSNLKNMSSDKLAGLSEGEEIEDHSKIANSSTFTIKASNEEEVVEEKENKDNDYGDNDKNNNTTINSSSTIAPSVQTPVLSAKPSVPKLNIPVPPAKRNSKVKTDQKCDPSNSLYKRSFISIRNNADDDDVILNNDSNESLKTGASLKLAKTRSLSRKSSPVIISPGSSSYTFFKKHHRTSSTEPGLPNIASQPIIENKEKLPEVDEKYLPKKKPNLSSTESSTKEKYIFCTKDKQSFVPINVTHANDVATFKATLATNNNINHKNYSIFLANYDFDIADIALDDSTIKSIMDADYSNGFNLFFIKNHLKIQLNRNRSNSSILSQPRKMSLKSTVSKSSLSSTDLEELDYGVKYPKTPSHLFENNNSQDYLPVSKPSRSRKLTMNNPATTNTNNTTEQSSFKVIRPDTTNKIDFNQKRETPFVKLNPTRDAPPPPPRHPHADDNDFVPVPFPNTPTQRRETKIPHRPPPPSMVLDQAQRNIVESVPTIPPRPGFSRKPSSLSLKKRASNASLSKIDHNHTRLSRSNSSIQSSVFTSPPRLLKRHSSRRIVSSALAGGDTFDENKISFHDAPAFSDDSDSAGITSDNDDGEENDKFVSAKELEKTVSFEKFDDTTKEDGDKFLFKDAEVATEESEDSEESDDSGIAWIKNTDKTGTKDNSNKKKKDSKKTKKGLLEGEISSDDHVSKHTKENLTSTDSDDGIVWTTSNKPEQITENKVSRNLAGNDSRSLLKDEFNDDDTLENQNATVADEEGEEDKTGFSFDSESILGSLVNELEESKNDNTVNSLARKMTLRPSADLVYKNLEVYFPGTDLDKPIFEGETPPGSPKNFNDSKFSKSNGSNSSSVDSKRHRNIIEASTIKHSAERDDYTFSSNNSTPHSSTNSNHRSQPPKRTKTLRILANEALEVRKKKNKRKDIVVATTGLADTPALRRNDTTKLWGRKVIEITDKEKIVAINKNRNSKGQYKEFAWIKGDVIGKGSFGCVYLGMNLTTGEMIAVKQVESSTSSQIEALRSEMETLKDIDHLNIVQYLGFEAKDNVYSLFLEYVAGGSVGALIRMVGRFDDALIRFLNQQVLQGLAYLHNLGILHRDMKADNLLLDLDGVCKISDFGISKKSSDIYSNSEMTMTGTIFWMAPEMVDTKQGYSAKVDIWSLGCIVLEMFAGKRPWSNLEVVAAMFKIGKYKSAPPIPKDTLPLISEEGIKFLDLCFQIDPEKRPTADYLLNNKIFAVDPNFKFADTELAKFTNQNHKTMSLPKDIDKK